jgi:hypothetical protein
LLVIPGGKEKEKGMEKEKEKEKDSSPEVRGEAKGRGSSPMMCTTAFFNSLVLGCLLFRVVVEPFAAFLNWSNFVIG